MSENQEMILKPKISQGLILLLVSLVLTLLGVFMLRDGRQMGWFVVGIFALMLLVSLVRLLPNSSYLKINAEGFTVCSLYRVYSNRWSDIRSFDVAAIGRRQMVVYNFSDSYNQMKGGRAVAKMMSGYEAALPDTYGMKAEELAALLNQRLKS